MELQHKTFAAPAVKVLDADQGVCEMIVSVFRNVDAAKERVMPGYFKDSIGKKLPKGVWAHDWTLPVAKTLEAEELMPGDTRLPAEIRGNGGLYIKGQFNMDTQRGREAFSDLKFGSVDEFSFGYVTEEKSYDSKSGITDLIKGTIYEWSPVLVGCNPATSLMSAKHALSAEESERMAKTISTATLEELKVKSQYLGENIEAAMTMAALSRLNDALFYNVLYSTVLGDDATPLADRLVTLSAAFDEFRDISLTTIRTLLSAAEEDAGESNDATDSAVSTAYATSAAQIASEVKALWRDPALLCGEGEAPAAKSFSDQSDAALAAATGLVSRAKALNLVRVKEGRVLSSAVRTRLATLKDALSESLTDIDALLTETEKPEKSGASALSGADGKALSLSLASEFLVLQAAQLEIA